MSDNGNWLSHGFKRVPSLFEAQSALGWGVVVVLLTLLAVVYLSHASQTIASGFHMQQLSAELKELQKENTYLEAQIAAGQSVEQLMAKAVQLGFVPSGPEEIEYLVVDNYPPTPGQPDVEVSTEPMASTGLLANWWGGLTHAFSGWTRSSAGETH